MDRSLITKKIRKFSNSSISRLSLCVLASLITIFSQYILTLISGVILWRVKLEKAHFPGPEFWASRYSRLPIYIIQLYILLTHSAYPRFFRCELNFWVKEARRNLMGKGTAATKKQASQNCALSLVRQLFHLGLVEQADVGQVQTKKRKVDEVGRFFHEFMIFICDRNVSSEKWKIQSITYTSIVIIGTFIC